jgi:hypothetical protein
MRLLIAVMLLSASACASQKRFGATPQTSPGMFWITWGKATATCNGQPCVLLDGGAATISSDQIIAGGLSGVAESGSTFFCSSPFAAPVEDYVTAEIGNDGTLWSPAATPNSALIDGGYGDGGVPGVIVVATQSSNLMELELTHLAAMVFDAGYFCDAGPTLPNVIQCFGSSNYGSYIDSGVNFCDGGTANFCDAGLYGYDLQAGNALSCNVNTVPR